MRNLRVLLVDDSTDYLESATHLLCSYPGVEVVGSALSGTDALDQVPRLHPDLVLMDLAMPEMTGVEATRRIKAVSAAPRIIILTLHDDLYYRAAAQEAGADGFISKSRLGKQLFPLMEQLFS